MSTASTATRISGVEPVNTLASVVVGVAPPPVTTVTLGVTAAPLASTAPGKTAGCDVIASAVAGAGGVPTSAAVTDGTVP